jgi:DNA mismatch repair ATPase MutS
MADEVEGVKNMFTTCRVENGELKLEYKVEEGKMQKSYGIEVMKILKFDQEVVDLAERFLKYYEREAEEDESNAFSEEVKTKAYKLIDELEDVLSRTPNSEHEQIRSSYKSKFREILGNA